MTLTLITSLQDSDGNFRKYIFDNMSEEQVNDFIDRFNHEKLVRNPKSINSFINTNFILEVQCSMTPEEEAEYKKMMEMEAEIYAKLSRGREV